MHKHQNWESFRDSGMLWWVNRIIHTFGWMIVLYEEDDGEVVAASPKRCTDILGFPASVDEEKLESFRAHIGAKHP